MCRVSLDSLDSLDSMCRRSVASIPKLDSQKQCLEKVCVEKELAEPTKELDEQHPKHRNNTTEAHHAHQNTHTKHAHYNAELYC